MQRRGWGQLRKKPDRLEVILIVGLFLATAAYLLLSGLALLERK